LQSQEDALRRQLFFKFLILKKFFIPPSSSLDCDYKDYGVTAFDQRVITRKNVTCQGPIRGKMEGRVVDDLVESP
jgi:hypothetical protein